MKKWIIGSGLVAFATLVVLFFVTAPTDEELIRQAIAESTEASREGRPSEVLEHLSKSITFNGVPVFDRSEIMKVVRLSRPEVTFSDYQPVIEGENAVVVADVHVKMEFQGINLDETVPGVQVRLAKETGLRWLVLPGTKWRITEVTAPDLAQLSGEIP